MSCSSHRCVRRTSKQSVTDTCTVNIGPHTMAVPVARSGIQGQPFVYSGHRASRKGKRGPEFPLSRPHHASVRKKAVRSAMVRRLHESEIGTERRIASPYSFPHEEREPCRRIRECSVNKYPSLQTGRFHQGTTRRSASESRNERYGIRLIRFRFRISADKAAGRSDIRKCGDREKQRQHLRPGPWNAAPHIPRRCAHNRPGPCQ